MDSDDPIILGYPRPVPPFVNNWRILWGLILGCLPGPLVFVGYLVSMDHGTFCERLMCPYTELWANMSGHIEMKHAILAGMQFPFYGLILGVCASRGRGWYGLIALLIIHFAWVCMLLITFPVTKY